MQTHELLDRYELLYPEVSAIADLRRAFIDQDLSSIFRLCDENEELRKAVIDDNLHSIFRILETLDIPNLEDIRKTVIEKNLHSLFRLTNGDEELRKAVIEKNMHSIFRLVDGNISGDIEDLRKAVIEKNLHSLFRLVDGNISGDIEDLRKAVVEQNLNSLFRLLGDSEQVWHIDDLRRAMIEENLYSLFRLFSEEDEDIHLYRTAIVNKNLRSIFKILGNDNLRKLIIDENVYKLWPILNSYVDTQFTSAFKSFFINRTAFASDCFSRGQLQSKLWLVDELKKCNVDLGTVFLCAGWYATLATMLFESKIKVGKIRSFDNDPTCAKIAEVFNKPWFEDDWRFKASTVDIMDFEWTDVPAPSDGTMGNFYYMTSGTDKPIQMKDNPDTIINTSCEHIENFPDWWEKIPAGKLVVLQSNNFFEVDEHVNCDRSLEEFSGQTPLNSVLYSGSLQLEKYTRYMRIGYK